MEIKSTSEEYNEIFKRKEISFFINHTSLGTPEIYKVRKSLSEKFNVNEDNVYVLRVDTKTGTNRTYGEAEIYDSIENAEKIVPKHIQIRNASLRHKKE